MRSGRVPWRGVAREGCALLEVALPVLADRWLGPRARRRVMDRVVIGMDPYKASVTIEARDSREVLRARGRFGTDKRNYALMLRTARQWPDRLWEVRAPTGSGARWPSDCWPMVSGCWTCRPSWRPGPGFSTPARAARPTPPTPPT